MAPRVVAGIPTWCEVGVIRAHAERVDAALRTVYRAGSCAIVHADNASPDGTAAEFSRARLTVPAHSVSSEARGKGRNFRALFKTSLELGAGALVTLDADLEELPRDWIPALAGPVLRGEADVVLPLYGRHWYDGNLTNQLAAPLVAAVTGRPLRQPIAGEFGFSQRALKALLALRWPPRALGFGVDSWCVLRLLACGLAIVQVPLSVGKLHSWRSDTAEEVGAEMQGKFEEIAGTLLAELAPLEPRRASAPDPFPASAPLGRPPKPYDSGHLAVAAAAAWDDRRRSDSLVALAGGDPGPRAPELHEEDWVRVLARALAWTRDRASEDDEMLGSLKALWLARIATVLPALEDDRVDPMVNDLAARLRALLVPGGP